jgi:hypothetical protein
MGWSEQYWEDVKSEMEQLGRERRAFPQDETPSDAPDEADGEGPLAPEPAEA